MKVLAIQLKRIGDLVLTTPALAALHRGGARVSLLVDGGCRSLLPAMEDLDERLVHEKRRGNGQLWRRLRAGGWDAVLDFTGNDRSALMSWVTRSPRRLSFAWVRSRWWKRLVYHAYADSAVRLRHTCDHYLDLAGALQPLAADVSTAPFLHLPAAAQAAATDLLAHAGVRGDFVLVHPGTARPEKYWPVGHWAEVIAGLRAAGHPVVITAGPDTFEQHHVREILLNSDQRPDAPGGRCVLVLPPDLITLAAVVARARLVLSCDTSVVHLAAAFQRPQIALFGPTNPFHWCPRHAQAVVFSAASPERALTEFQPKSKGAPMERLPAPVVLAEAMRQWSSASASADTI